MSSQRLTGGRLVDNGDGELVWESDQPASTGDQPVTTGDQPASTKERDPTCEQCKKWLTKQRTDPITGACIIAGSSDWHWWADWTSNLLGEKVIPCNGIKGRLKWVQCSQEAFHNCPYCLNRLQLFAVHVANGDHECIYCLQKVNLCYVCMTCNGRSSGRPRTYSLKQLEKKEQRSALQILEDHRQRRHRSRPY